MLRSRLGSERGQALVFVVLALSALVGMAALVLDVGHWYVTQRKAQTAADAGALAAAWALPDQNTARTDGADYAAKNIADAHLTGATAVVTTPFGGQPNKVEVKVKADASVFFAPLLGIDSMQVNARAVAARSSAVSGAPLAVYVHERCGASTGNKGLIINGRDALIEGGIHVNGHFELGGDRFRSVGQATMYRPPPQGTSPTQHLVGGVLVPSPSQGSGCKKPNRSDDLYCTGCSGGSKPQPSDGQYRDWVTPYHTEAIMKSSTPCTFNWSGDKKYENQVIPNGVHCLPNSKKFTIAGNSSGNITVIGGMIEVGGSGTLRPFNPSHPVLFYSTNTAGTPIKVNPSGAYNWSGYIINRKGGIEINAAGVTSPLNGLLEAEWIVVNGENFRMLGTFPDSSGGAISGAVVLEE